MRRPPRLHGSVERQKALPTWQERHLARLVRATDHVAPRYSSRQLRESRRLRDAAAVVKMWSSGVPVKILGGELLRRLAADDYARRRT